MTFFSTRPAPGAFLWDMTGEGDFTISDVWAWGGLGLDWFVWCFFLPGDFALWLFLERPLLQPIGHFLEVSTDWYGGWISGIASATTWLFGMGLAIVLGDLVTGSKKE